MRRVGDCMRNITMMQSQWEAQRCTGKNLFDISKITHGISSASYARDEYIQVDNGVIKSTYGLYNVAQWLFDSKVYLKAGTYTLSADVLINDTSGNGTDSLHCRMFLKHCDSGSFFWGNVIVLPDFSIWKRNSNTFELTEEGYYEIGLQAFGNNIKYYNLDVRFKNIMLCKGTDTEYEPYCGGSPSALRIEACKGGYFSDIEEYALRVVGKQFQDGTPTLESPTPIQCVKEGTKLKVCGKNLIEYPYHTGDTYTANGLTFTVNSDKTITVNGTATAQTIYQITYQYGFQFSSNEKLFLSGCPEGGSSSTYRLGGYTNSGGSFWDYGSGISTYDGKDRKFSVIIQIQSGTVCNNLVFKPMLETGSAKTKYEPYISGGTLTTPCDLYEKDIWYPTSGKVEKYTYRRVITDGGAIVKTNGQTNTYHTSRLSPGREADSCCSNCFIQGTWTTNPGYCYVYDVLYFTIAESDYTLEEVRAKINELNKNGTPLEFIWRDVNPLISYYAPQIASMPKGTVNIIQEPTELPSDLETTALVRR